MEERQSGEPERTAFLAAEPHDRTPTHDQRRCHVGRPGGQEGGQEGGGPSGDIPRPLLSEDNCHYAASAKRDCTVPVVMPDQGPGLARHPCAMCWQLHSLRLHFLCPHQMRWIWHR